MIRNEPRDKNVRFENWQREISTGTADVLQLIAEGKTNKEVATKLNLSVYTVDSHRGKIMEKLNLHSAGELVRVRYEEWFGGLGRRGRNRHDAKRAAGQECREMTGTAHSVQRRPLALGQSEQSRNSLGLRIAYCKAASIAFSIS